MSAPSSAWSSAPGNHFSLRSADPLACARRDYFFLEQIISVLSLCYNVDISNPTRIAALERREAELNQIIADATAERRGVAAELDYLREAATIIEDLVNARRTDAVLAILRRHNRPLAPKDIQTELRDAGRDEPTNRITATLNHLLRAGKATNEERASWRAI
jgi:hypothetical protein